MSKSKESGALSIPLMAVAFLAIAGFLYWLSVTSEPTQLAVAEEDPRAVLPQAIPVTFEGFAEDPAAQLGRRIQVPGVQVGSLLGFDAFWADLPAEEEEVPYLFRIDRTLVDDRVQILPGDVMTVTGTVHAMSDSVITAWEDLGVFTAEGQRAEVRELETFLDVDEVALDDIPDPDAADPGDDDTDPGAGR